MPSAVGASESINWAQTVATGASALLGVMAGALLSRGTARQQFMRDRAMGEVTLRRGHYATFQKALWAYASRVKTARDLAGQLEQARQAKKPSPTVTYDLKLTKARQEACRDAFADLTLFASSDAQHAARQGMESLTSSLEAIRRGKPDEAEQHFATYERAFTAYAEAVNEDVAVVNAMIYAFLTPFWRAVLHKVRRAPLPFEVVDPPKDFQDPRPDKGEEGPNFTLAETST